MRIGVKVYLGMVRGKKIGYMWEGSCCECKNAGHGREVLRYRLEQQNFVSEKTHIAKKAARLGTAFQYSFGRELARGQKRHPC
jgi:hypothetical protein